jgi:hypothetical protein
MAGSEGSVPVGALLRQLAAHGLTQYLDHKLLGLGTPLVTSIVSSMAIARSEDQLSDFLWTSFFTNLQSGDAGSLSLLAGKETSPDQSTKTFFVSTDAINQVPVDSVVIALLKMQEAAHDLRSMNRQIAQDPIAKVYALLGAKEHVYDFAPTLASLKTQLDALDASVAKALRSAPSAFNGDTAALKSLTDELRKAAAVNMLIDAYTRLIGISIWAYHNPLPALSPSGFINSNIDLMSELGDRLLEVERGNYSKVAKSVYRAHWYADSYLQGINDGRTIQGVGQVYSVIIGADGFLRTVKAVGASFATLSIPGPGMMLQFAGAGGPSMGGIAINVATGELVVVSGSTLSSTTLAIGVVFSKAVDPKGLGPAGESAVPGTQNSTRIPSTTGTTEYRVPDRLTEVTLEEIKNVLKLSNTRQLKDYLDYAKSTGRTFTIWVRGNAGGAATKVSGPLMELRNSGRIIIKPIPGTGTWP